MGSTGKSNAFSDVDSKTTPMSKEDAYTVGENPSTRYFQSSDSFNINEALRLAADEGISIDEALNRIEEKEFWWNKDDVARAREIIEAMDRNMQPTNKEMRVLRMADAKYLDRILKQANIPDNLRNNIVRAVGTWDLTPTQSQLDALKSYLVGGKVYENAFMSTSHNLSLSDTSFGSRRVIIDMRVGKGTRGMFSPTGEESEFVINRHEGYTIKGIELTNDGKLRILVDVNM